MTDIAPIPSHVPQHLVVDFDYYNFAGGSDDIHLAWKKLHDEPDIFWTPRNGGHWVATRADDIEEIFKDYEHFTSSRGMSIPIKQKPFAFPPVEVDPPEQMAYRKLIAPFFTPKSVGELEKRARRITLELIEGFIGRGECEFYSEFSLHMPIGIFLSLVDLPDSDRLYLLKLADIAVRASDMKVVEEGFQKTWAYLAAKMAERAVNPGGDMISALTQAEIGGRKLTQEESLGIGSVVLFGGLDTVAATLGFVARFLAESPAHRKQLIGDPAIIPGAVEELLRRFAVANLARTLAQDYEYKGIAMKNGDPILIPSVLANLDERRFPDPLTVDFKRKNVSRHMTFGAGAHRCIGSFLARTELKAFLEEWLKHIPDFAITPGKQVDTRSGSVMAVVNLPLSWKV